MNKEFRSFVRVRRLSNRLGWFPFFGLLPCMVFCSVLAALEISVVHGQAIENDVPLEVANLWPEDITIEEPPPTRVIFPAYTELWLEAIKHSETDLQQELISLFEQIHRNGIDQSAIAVEIRSLINENNHHTVNIAAASLLVALDDQASADVLFALTKPGLAEISLIVEPALARWGFEPAIVVWQQRLSQQRIRRTLLVLAIDCLGIIQDESSLEDLVRVAMDRTEGRSIRMAAARAAGAIGGEGLAKAAVKLSGQGSPGAVVNRLCSIAFLSDHQSDVAIKLIQKLLLDEDGAVAGAAWHRLLEIDSALAIPIVEQCLKNEDPIVRKSVVTAMFEQPTLASIESLGEMMNDRHPDIRVAARFALRRLAKQNEKFDQAVRMAGMKALHEIPNDYRGIEQGLILLAALDHKPAAGRATELIQHDHPKVFVTAAWTVRVLQVENTFEALLRHVDKLSDVVMAHTRSEEESPSVHHLNQIAHLFDLFGESDYRDAEELLRRFVPKNQGLLNNCRPAAITALGKFHRDDPGSNLVRQLVKRMNDQTSETAESSEVWATCAIALGRMKAKSALSELRKYYFGEPTVSGFSYATAWSIRELTGEDFPPPVSKVISTSGFNLEPIGQRLGIAEKGHESTDN